MIVVVIFIMIIISIIIIIIIIISQRYPTSILGHGFPGNLPILRFFQALLALDPVDETVTREGFDFTLREYVF